MARIVHCKMLVKSRFGFIKLLSQSVEDPSFDVALLCGTQILHPDGFQTPLQRVAPSAFFDLHRNPHGLIPRTSDLSLAQQTLYTRYSTLFDRALV